MRKEYLLLVFSTLFLNCNYKKKDVIKSGIQNTTDSSVSKNMSEFKESDSTYKYSSIEGKGYFDYVYSNDTIIQKARISVVNEKDTTLFCSNDSTWRHLFSIDTLFFTLTTINKKRNMRRVFSDTAYRYLCFDGENPEDDITGDMYGAITYIYYSKSCEIKLNPDFNKRLYIDEFDCDSSLHNLRYCPFTSIRILRR